MAFAFHTPVRRNHIIGPAGVGSLIVTRSAVTALMCGLPSWLNSAPARGADEAAKRKDRADLLSGLALHDRNMERDLGIRRLISPPVVGDEARHGVTWFVPAVRFPRAEYCHNPSCKAIGYASPESPSIGRCTECGGKRPSRRQQVPMVMVCPAGHLDEVDWLGLTHPHGSCMHPRLTYHLGSNIIAPEIRCTSCGVKERLNPREPVPCTGARPWLPGYPKETCAEQMRILDRTSTQVYFADIRSLLHIPADGDLRDAVLRWLQDDPIAHALSEVPGDPALAPLLDRALPLFPDLTMTALAAHVAAINNSVEPEPGRGPELEALTSGRRGVHTTDGPPVLDAEVIPPNTHPTHVGSQSPIAQVVAVHRLAETRALAGFTRVEPPIRGGIGATGYHLLWGSRQEINPHADWLPGQRVYGEGILLELNAITVAKWSKQATRHLLPVTLQGETLTVEFQLAHTLAHLLMNAAALQCGYPIASLRDRIYDLPGRTALLIYTGEGDTIGTMGGLVELAQRGELEHLLDVAYANARWCGLDPVCLEPVQHIRHGTAGACHQCCLLPETSCDWWNEGLDRATLIGRGPMVGYLDMPDFP